MPPFAGHVQPTVGVAEELRRRGHEVGWCGDGRLLARLLPAGATILPCPAAPLAPRSATLRGFPAMKFLWEEVLVPLARSMAPAVRDAVATFRPDMLVVDQQALAGAKVAQQAGLPWVTAATMSGELADPLARLPKVQQWLRELLADFGAGDPRFSPHLVLAFTTKALVGAGADIGVPVRYVGPVTRPRNSTTGFPWSWLDPTRPLVYVSLGTVNSDARFLDECVTALRSRTRLHAVVADPGGVLGSSPMHVLVQREVPQVELLAHARVVVCHAGHNTVCEALADGVPLVVAPIRDDQPIVADQVVAAGAGVRLRFAHATARHIGEAVDAVLSEPGYRRSARRIRASFRRAGGAFAAVDQMELLLSRVVW